MTLPAHPSRSLMFLITGLYRGGAETQLLLVVRELLARGWEIKIVSMISGGPLYADFDDLGIPVFTLNMRRALPDPRAIMNLARLLRREHPAVFHTHMVHANLLGRLATMVAPVPVVVSTVHNMREGSRWREWAYRMTDPLADLTTIVSQAAASRYIKIGSVPERKLRTVPNGVQLETLSSDREVRAEVRTKLRAKVRASLGLDHQFVWLAVGRFDAEKDYPNLLAAAAQLGNEPALLLIAGDGPLRPWAEQLAARFGLSQKVRFLGIRTDVSQLMAAADAYVMSSACEGLPMVLLEAAASALPIVTTDVGGTGEIVLHEVSGFVVTPHNSGALAAAMERIEHLPAEARLEMGNAGRAHVAQRYSLSAVVDQWEEIYQSLLQRKCAAISRVQSFSRI